MCCSYDWCVNGRHTYCFATVETIDNSGIESLSYRCGSCASRSAAPPLMHPAAPSEAASAAAPLIRPDAGAPPRLASAVASTPLSPVDLTASAPPSSNSPSAPAPQTLISPAASAAAEPVDAPPSGLPASAPPPMTSPADTTPFPPNSGSGSGGPPHIGPTEAAHHLAASRESAGTAAAPERQEEGQAPPAESQTAPAEPPLLLSPAASAPPSPSPTPRLGLAQPAPPMMHSPAAYTRPPSSSHAASAPASPSSPAASDPAPPIGPCACKADTLASRDASTPPFSDGPAASGWPPQSDAAASAPPSPSSTEGSAPPSPIGPSESRHHLLVSREAARAAAAAAAVPSPSDSQAAPARPQLANPKPPSTSSPLRSALVSLPGTAAASGPPAGTCSRPWNRSARIPPSMDVDFTHTELHHAAFDEQDPHSSPLSCTLKLAEQELAEQEDAPAMIAAALPPVDTTRTASLEDSDSGDDLPLSARLAKKPRPDTSLPSNASSLAAGSAKPAAKQASAFQDHAPSKGSKHTSGGSKPAPPKQASSVGTSPSSAKGRVHTAGGSHAPAKHVSPFQDPMDEEDIPLNQRQQGRGHSQLARSGSSNGAATGAPPEEGDVSLSERQRQPSVGALQLARSSSSSTGQPALVGTPLSHGPTITGIKRMIHPGVAATAFLNEELPSGVGLQVYLPQYLYSLSTHQLVATAWRPLSPKASARNRATKKLELPADTGSSRQKRASESSPAKTGARQAHRDCDKPVQQQQRKKHKATASRGEAVAAVAHSEKPAPPSLAAQQPKKPTVLDVSAATGLHSDRLAAPTPSSTAPSCTGAQTSATSMDVDSDAEHSAKPRPTVARAAPKLSSHPPPSALPVSKPGGTSKPEAALAPKLDFPRSKSDLSKPQAKPHPGLSRSFSLPTQSRPTAGQPAPQRKAARDVDFFDDLDESQGEALQPAPRASLTGSGNPPPPAAPNAARHPPQAGKSAAARGQPPSTAPPAAARSQSPAGAPAAARLPAGGSRPTAVAGSSQAAGPPRPSAGGASKGTPSAPPPGYGQQTAGSGKGAAADDASAARQAKVKAAFHEDKARESAEHLQQSQPKRLVAAAGGLHASGAQRLLSQRMSDHLSARLRLQTQMCALLADHRPRYRAEGLLRHRRLRAGGGANRLTSMAPKTQIEEHEIVGLAEVKSVNTALTSGNFIARWSGHISFPFPDQSVKAVALIMDLKAIHPCSGMKQLLDELQYWEGVDRSADVKILVQLVRKEDFAQEELRARVFETADAYRHRDFDDTCVILHPHAASSTTSALFRTFHRNYGQTSYKQVLRMRVSYPPVPKPLSSRPDTPTTAGAGSAPAGSAPAGSAPAGSAPSGSAPAGSAPARRGVLPAVEPGGEAQQEAQKKAQEGAMRAKVLARKLSKASASIVKTGPTPACRIPLRVKFYCQQTLVSEGEAHTNSTYTQGDFKSRLSSEQLQEQEAQQDAEDAAAELAPADSPSAASCTPPPDDDADQQQRQQQEEQQQQQQRQQIPPSSSALTGLTQGAARASEPGSGHPERLPASVQPAVSSTISKAAVWKSTSVTASLPGLVSPDNAPTQPEPPKHRERVHPPHHPSHPQPTRRQQHAPHPRASQAAHQHPSQLGAAPSHPPH
ncbi:MAG: hypothetical protein WDW38_004385 [Sanguina aurantia]